MSFETRVALVELRKANEDEGHINSVIGNSVTLNGELTKKSLVEIFEHVCLTEFFYAGGFGTLAKTRGLNSVFIEGITSDGQTISHKYLNVFLLFSQVLEQFPDQYLKIIFLYNDEIPVLQSSNDPVPNIRNVPPKNSATRTGVRGRKRKVKETTPITTDITQLETEVNKSPRIEFETLEGNQDHSNIEILECEMETSTTNPAAAKDAKSKHRIFELDMSIMQCLRNTWYTDGMEEKDVAWNTNCDMLLEFFRQFKTCNASWGVKAKAPDGGLFSIGRWLSDQRQAKAKGKLAPDRELRLQKLADEGKLVWFTEGAASLEDVRWDRMYNALVQYGAEHNNDCNIPRSYSCTLSDGSVANLGEWLHDQRRNKTDAKRKLLPERERRLQDLVDEGKLNWVLVHGERWDRMFQLLLKYGEEHGGDCNVPQHYIHTGPDGTVSRLGQWLNAQRVIRKGNSRVKQLPEDREFRLQALVDHGKLAWELASQPNRTVRWEHMFDLLIEYGAQHGGDCNVPRAYRHVCADGAVIGLGQWLSDQRKMKRGTHGSVKTLQEDREKKLQALVDEGRLFWIVESRKSIGTNPISPAASHHPIAFSDSVLAETTVVAESVEL